MLLRMSIVLLLFLTTLISAETSRETDSLALLAIKDANPHSTFFETWNDSTILEEWEGITTSETTGRVILLRINSGEIDTIPEEFCNLELYRVNFTGNRLRSLPAGFNNMTTLVGEDTTRYPMYSIYLGSNYLGFEDLEQLQVSTPILYEPQNQFPLNGASSDSLYDYGDVCTLSVDCGGEFTQFHWYKDGKTIENNSNTLVVPVNSYLDCGVYSCSITTTAEQWSELTIYTDSILIATQESFALRAQDSLILLQIAAQNPTLYTTFLPSTPMEEWRYIGIGNNRVNYFEVISSSSSQLYDLALLTGLEDLYFRSGSESISGTIPWEELNLQLKRLTLVSQYTNKIPKEIFKLSALEELKMTSMIKLDQLVTLTELKSLKKLHLDAASTFKIYNLGALSSLEYLVLHNGCILEELNGVEKLQNLKELYIEYLEDSLPSTITQLSTLEVLSIKDDYNYEKSLKELPATIGDLKNLKSITVSACELTALPESFGELESLEEIDFYWNNIDRLPASFLNLSNLKRFSFYHNNYIEDLPAGFNSLPNLEFLGFGYNMLSFGELEFLRNSFPGAHLQSIGQNPISYIEGETEISEGDDLILTVHGCGGDSTVYQWFKDSILLGEYKDTFAIKNVTNEESGNYYAVMTNPLFPSENTHYSDTVHVQVGSGTAITFKHDVESLSEYSSFAVVPSIVKAGEDVDVIIPQSIKGKGTLKVYDALQNLIDIQDVNLDNGGVYSWDGTNLTGRPVASGEYVVILSVEDAAGINKQFKANIGVRE